MTAATSWPEAAVAMPIVSVAATIRARMSVQRAVAEPGALRSCTGELERPIKAVE